MIKRAPSLANSESASHGFSPTPTARSASICSSIFADGGTVPSHGVGLLQFVLTDFEGTYAVALMAPGDLQQLGGATAEPPTLLLLPHCDSDGGRARSHRELARVVPMHPCAAGPSGALWSPGATTCGERFRTPASGRRAAATSRQGIVVRHDTAGSGAAMISLLGRGLEHMSTDTFCNRRPSWAPAQRRLAHLQPARQALDLGGPPAARRRLQHDHRPLLLCDDLKPC